MLEPLVLATALVTSLAPPPRPGPRPCRATRSCTGGVNNVGMAIGLVRADFTCRRVRASNVEARNFLAVGTLKLVQPVRPFRPKKNRAEARF